MEWHGTERRSTAAPAQIQWVDGSVDARTCAHAYTHAHPQARMQACERTHARMQAHTHASTDAWTQVLTRLSLAGNALEPAGEPRECYSFNSHPKIAITSDVFLSR